LIQIECWTAQETNLNSSAENIFDKWQFFYLWNRCQILCSTNFLLILRDPKPPLCTCVIIGQWVLPCHDKMEMGLNWLASNAWEEWKNLIGFEEPMYSVLMLFLHNVITARLLAANRTGTTPFRLRASANQDLSSC
jgi:hypothetical protein